jgi:hypothetical protein
MGASSIGERDNRPHDAHRLGTDSASICKVHDAASHAIRAMCADFRPGIGQMFPKN